MILTRLCLCVPLCVHVCLWYVSVCVSMCVYTCREESLTLVSFLLGLYLIFMSMYVCGIEACACVFECVPVHAGCCVLSWLAL